MITINLLPPEFRVQPKSTRHVPYVKAAIAAGILLSLLTVYFYIDLLIAGSKLKKIQAEWAKIQPQSVELKKLENEVENILKPEKVFLESFVTSQRPLTSLMIWASELLPDNIWLTEFRMERKQDGGVFFLKGLAVPSKEKSSIEAIEIFLHHFKEKVPEANLSLTTTRQILEETELTQFLANFKWGGGEEPTTP
jgi:hypothetical protein